MSRYRFFIDGLNEEKAHNPKRPRKTLKGMVTCTTSIQQTYYMKMERNQAAQKVIN
ncbi:hypothetical protein [Bacillus pumilus]|uniref:hypothetical protein n=1 Tax=Bacillus pumilus TaxID=1408 RepID=UPI003305D61A